MVDGHALPASFSEEPLHGIRLAITKLREETTTCAQPGRRLARQAAIEIQPVRATVERGMRVDVAHLGLQRGDFTGRNVRRIAEE